MGDFKVLTINEIKELDDLLEVAEASVSSAKAVIKGNTSYAKIVGGAIGGSIGATIASSAGSVGVTAALGKSVVAAAGASMSLVAIPLIIMAIIGGGIYWWFQDDKKKEERQKQAVYIKKITEKMQKILDEFEALKKEHERTNNEKDEIIKAQKEKLAEYEVIFEALKRKREILENNLKSA